MRACGFRVQGSGFRVQGSGFRVQGSGFRVQGSGFKVQGPGFRVQGVGLSTAKHAEIFARMGARGTWAILCSSEERADSDTPARVPVAARVACGRQSEGDVFKVSALPGAVAVSAQYVTCTAWFVPGTQCACTCMGCTTACKARSPEDVFKVQALGLREAECGGSPVYGGSGDSTLHSGSEGAGVWKEWYPHLALDREGGDFGSEVPHRELLRATINPTP